MNAQDPQNTSANPQPEAAVEAASGPKAPARKRAPRAAKPVGEVASAEVSAAPEASAPAAQDEAAAKPKRTRKKPAAPAEAEPVAAPEAAAPAVAVAGAAPDDTVQPAARPARKRARPAASQGAVPDAATDAAPDVPAAQASTAAAEVAPAEAREVPPAPPEFARQAPAHEDAVLAQEGGAGEGGESTEGGPAGDNPESGDGRRRRNRNRRRGRRGERGDEALAAGEAGAAEGAARPKPADQDNFTVVTVAAGDDDDDEAADAPADASAPALPAPDAAAAFANVVSGVYDAEAGEVPPEPEKRVLLPDPDAPKLHKVLAQAGVGSRRDMEQLIADGKVEVNGHTAHVGQRVSFGDRISVGGRTIKVRIAPLPARVIAYHKPVGEVVTHDDPQHRPTVFRRLPRLPQGKWQSVGRLDINTEGLLLFTNSGELANQLMHPRFGVEREYAVRVLGTLDSSARQKLLDGVEIDGQRAAFKSIDEGGGEGVNHWYRVVITEGRNREVRKLFDKVGLGVSRLIRIRYGCVVLPRGLKRGVYVDMNAAEVGELRRMAARPGHGAGHKPGAGQGGHAQGGQGRPGGPRPPRPEGREGRDGRDVREAREGDGPRGPRPPRDKFRGGPRDESARRDGQGQQAARDKRREPRPRDPDAEYASIPNPLMQTFDKRAIREARQPRREYSEDGPIPNPLEQTYDKRGVQKQRGLGGGGGRKGGGGGGGQPDPMKTSLGYIGADAFVRKFQGNGGGGGGGRGRKRGGR